MPWCAPMRSLPLALLALIGCTAPPAVTAPPPPVVAIPSATPSAVAPAPIPVCANLSADAKAAAKSLFAAEKKKVPSPPPDGYDEDLFTTPPIVGSCFEDAGGAFVVTIDQAKLQDGWPQVEIRWALTHVAPDGQRAQIIPTEVEDNTQKPEAYNWLHGYPGTMNAEVSGHLIGGRMLIFVLVQGHYHEDRDFSRGRLFAWEEGRIEAYKPAASISVDGIRDVDGDGILDLETFGPFDTDGEHCQSGFGMRLSGPKLLAHGLPDGTFSMTDEAASAFAKKSCPKSPPSILTHGAEDDVHRSVLNIACMRLWGASAQSVEARARRECPPLPPERQCEAGVCSDQQELLEWAVLEPPLILK